MTATSETRVLPPKISVQRRRRDLQLCACVFVHHNTPTRRQCGGGKKKKEQRKRTSFKFEEATQTKSCKNFSELITERNHGAEFRAEKRSVGRIIFVGVAFFVGGFVVGLDKKREPKIFPFYVARNEQQLNHYTAR